MTRFLKQATAISVLGALKKESVCFHIECNVLALFPEDINVNVQMLCMLKCH